MPRMLGASHGWGVCYCWDCHSGDSKADLQVLKRRQRRRERTYTLREVAQEFGVNLDGLTDDLEE